MNDIPVKDYFNPSKQKRFQNLDTADTNLSPEKWVVFSENVNAVLSTDRRCANSTIVVERYHISDTSYTSAFFVDSDFRKVLAIIPLIKSRDTVKKKITI